MFEALFVTNMTGIYK